jgi:peroxiredoxin
MKKILFVAVAVAGINCSLLAQPPVGSKAPDISLPTENGEITKLSSFRGKVVLLDFWASWCRPCRTTNRQVQPVYKKYKDKGFEIFSVSVDGSKPAWLSAVKQDNIQWTHVIDTKAANGNQLTNIWNIRYIPSTFLIDKEGTILAVGPEKDELEKWLKKLL